MRVLLTGSTGRLGGAFLSLWGDNGGTAGYDLQVVTRHDCDLSRPDEVGRFLRTVDFDVLINPAAMTGLEQCLDSPEVARAVNAESPRVMAEVCREKGARLVHFSTDYVFSGESEGRKSEDDPVGAVNVYGATKLAGERAVIDASAEAMVCRVSWLFGPTTADRPTYFDHVIERALAGELQHPIADKYSVPTFTHDIVEWVDVLLANDASGVYHLCNAGEPESWLSYAEKICVLARRHGRELGDVRLCGTSLEDADFFREKRPVHTAMLPTRLQSEGLALPRHWLKAAEVYLKIR
jgi:dTDP-4-dehydrorhamnose reductase